MFKDTKAAQAILKRAKDARSTPADIDDRRRKINNKLIGKLMQALVLEYEASTRLMVCRLIGYTDLY
jgi:hypothetical protein